MLKFLSLFFSVRDKTVLLPDELILKENKERDINYEYIKNNIYTQ